MAQPYWQQHYVLLFLAAVLFGMIGFVVVNPFMSNDSVFGGPIGHWLGFLLPVVPVALLLHFGVTRRASIMPVQYALKVVLGALAASALALLILAALIIVITGEFI